MPAAGEPPPHSLKVEVCAEIVSGRYMSPQVAAARQGFRNISKAQLAQILRDTGEAVDESLSEYGIVLQAFNAFHPEVDEQLMFQYLAARAHHSKRIVGESFFNEESVKCCFDESDLKEIEKSAEFLAATGQYLKELKAAVKTWMRENRGGMMKED